MASIDATPVMPEEIAGFSQFGYMDLQKVSNARDLGGMPVAGGRRIREHRLMRSGDLHKASAADIEQLTKVHGLVQVVDLRAPDEAEDAQDPMPLMAGVRYVCLPALPESVVGTIGRSAFGNDMRIADEFIADPFDTIKDLYLDALQGELGKKAYTTLLHMLLEIEEGATLWHCTQGKDRTGIGAILVEHCLGASHDDIRRDYLATNLFMRGWMERVGDILHEKGLAKSLAHDIEAFSYAHLYYFDAAMHVLEDEFGGIDAYLESQLGIGATEQERLRALYTE